MSSANDFGKWLKLGQELGLETTEVRQFVLERQAEQKAERDNELAQAEKIRQAELEEKIRLATIEAQRLKDERESEIAEKIRQAEFDEKIRLAEETRIREEKELA